jgi:hypothetical protein
MGRTGNIPVPPNQKFGGKRNVWSRYFFGSGSWYSHSLHHSAEGIPEEVGRRNERFLSFGAGLFKNF